MSKTKCAVLVKHHLEALTLPTMCEGREKVASQAAIGNLDHLACIQRLCELELIERRRKAARFPQTTTLDEANVAQQPSIKAPRTFSTSAHTCSQIIAARVVGPPSPHKRHRGSPKPTPTVLAPRPGTRVDRCLR